MKKGAYQTTKKDGTVYYRANITHAGRHVSLGSFDSEDDASEAYRIAHRLYADKDITILNISDHHKPLSFDKAVTILNHRDHGIYIKTPIYLRTGYFSYFLKGVGELKFDNDDLFYYSEHRILVHDGHIYVNDFGMQYGILARYGIKNFAVAGKDYAFANGDSLDFRYQNIIVINRYHGVTKKTVAGRDRYEAKIHINGEYLIGRFSSDAKAAVAYNKAADAATDAGVPKNFIQNYVVDYTAKQYADVYSEIRLPEKYLVYLTSFSQ
ncbi:MAG: hypothetical protein IJT32_02435 [Lachnospiraceae bacterium]|nr:hypothetical protein [Lachnospiraceae bacterium]